MLNHAKGDLNLVIVLEEDSAVRDSLKFALGLAGMNVRVFGTVAALLDDAVLPFAACLIVGHHPPKLDGFRVFSQLQRAGAQTPVILLTDHAKTAVRRRASRAGINCVIELPVFDGTLLESIREVLGGSPQSE